VLDVRRVCHRCTFGKKNLHGVSGKLVLFERELRPRAAFGRWLLASSRPLVVGGDVIDPAAVLRTRAPRALEAPRTASETER
jgi:hypothetical protein